MRVFFGDCGNFVADFGGHICAVQGKDSLDGGAGDAGGGKGVVDGVFVKVALEGFVNLGQVGVIQNLRKKEEKCQ